MNITRRRALQVAATAAAILALPAYAKADTAIDIVIGSNYPLSILWIGHMKEVFAKEVDRRLIGSGYRINWREAYGGTVFKSPQDTLEVVRSGIVDIAWVGTLFESKRMPLQNVTYFSPFATSDVALAIDVVDRLHTEIPALAAAWTRNNTVYLGGMGPDTYHIWTREPISSHKDLKGLKFSTPGIAANFLQGTGAVPVQSQIPNYYTDVQLGVTQGFVSFATAVLPVRAYEVAPYLTKVGIGAMYAGGIAMNMDKFNGLPAEVQQAIREAGRIYAARVGADTSAQSDLALAEMVKNGVTVGELPDAEKRNWVNSLPNLAQRWAEDNPSEPCRDVLKAWFAALRQHGHTPLRAWDEEI